VCTTVQWCREVKWRDWQLRDIDVSSAVSKIYHVRWFVLDNSLPVRVMHYSYTTLFRSPAHERSGTNTSRHTAYVPCGKLPGNIFI